MILTGAGMLSDVARDLVSDGWRVVQPSRRYVPVPADEVTHPTGRAIWVEARWDEPEALVRDVDRALDGEFVDLVVVWLHDADRPAVMNAVEPLLSPMAPVVDVRSMSDVGAVPEQAVGRAVQHVFLGNMSARNGRPLGQTEIVDGVRAAVAQALAGAPPARHDVGLRRVQPAAPRPRVHGLAALFSRRAHPAVG
ncbi:hypothetical protein SacazDRAFT_01319 [Saccharomonospora azurea NA-128]|uniref:Uncharacterized protein n=2 Tax=Saccharomonospora azurea TaxID=40988 RepID=H8G6A8_9PSEU|nr:hypothetical protein SacazDRAFT_01319 [Saccharomonospora azurea NA-128]